MPTPPTAKSSGCVRYILIALALAALACLLWKLTPVLLVAFGGIVVATLLRAMARPLRRFSRLSDHARVGIALAVFLGATGGVLWLFGHQVGTEADELRRLLPEQTARVAAWLNMSALGRMAVQSAYATAHDAKTFDGLGLVAVTIFGSALDAILIVFLGLYFARDPRFYLEAGLQLLPVRRRDEDRGALIEAGEALTKWLIAQLVAMAVVGVRAPDERILV